MAPSARSMRAPQAQASRILQSHPIALGEIALSRPVLERCASLDERVRKSSAILASLGPKVDHEVLRCAESTALDLAVPSHLLPVRFPSKPGLADALCARPGIASCAVLSAALAANALTPWHLRQANADALAYRMLPFRTGFHHLAPDADGIQVVFPPTDCARVLTALCRWLNANSSLPVVVQGLIAYLQVCKLHAFHDGNGRTARVLLTAALNARLVAAPRLYLPLAAVIFANAEYVSATYRRASCADELDAFVAYGASLIARTLDAADAVAARLAQPDQQDERTLQCL